MTKTTAEAAAAAGAAWHELKTAAKAAAVNALAAALEWVERRLR